MLGVGLSPLGEREPGAAIDEFTGGIEMAGVARRLGDDVQNDGPQIGQSPLTEEVRPGARLGVEGSGGDYGVRLFDLLAVAIENLLRCCVG
jgi:hypothetical protein